jgi:predicted AAA+ superfamily ATPase
MIEREIQSELEHLSKSYPVITVTGPRQAGKTTITKATFPHFNYCNLEHPEIRNVALTDPNAFFKQYPCPVIIDEIQRVPSLLSFIQVLVDERQENGLFILTGSQQLSLNEAISQSLAGRTALLHLLPLSILELERAGYSIDRDELLVKGFLPGVYDRDLDPNKAYRNYFQTYIERDIRQLIRLKNMTGFENFLRILASRVGQIINLHSISNDLGISSTTLSEWLSILQASFIIIILHPYYENFGKRIIKSPKLYFSEIGIVSYLLGIENKKQAARDPLLGNLFENMVVIEAIKSRLNKGLDHNLYFFRDNNKNEVDLLYKKQRKLIPIEIKAAMTYNDHLLKGVTYFQKVNNLSEQGYLIYSGELAFEKEAARVIHFKDCYKIFE